MTIANVTLKIRIAKALLMQLHNAIFTFMLKQLPQNIAIQKEWFRGMNNFMELYSTKVIANKVG